MRQVHLVRHGQTRWNDEGRIQGWCYVGLNKRGQQQAQDVASYLAKTHPTIEEIYTSDLPRALQTAKIITSKEPFHNTPIYEDPVWRERDFGVFQGYDSQRFFSEYPEYAILETGNDAAHEAPEQGESYADFDRRVRRAWTEFVDSVSVPESCIVTHSGVIRQILAHIEEFDYKTAIAEIPLENCSVTTISFSRDDHRIDSQNGYHFLKDQTTAVGDEHSGGGDQTNVTTNLSDTKQ
ncbi:histidine phosphatase family protein [Natrialbaceae archaeon A-CW3]